MRRDRRRDRDHRHGPVRAGGSRPPAVAPVRTVDDKTHCLELWHGPTCAFKDMALTVLPYLLKKSMEVTGINDEVLILAATSGDTGKAALEGFRDVEGTKVAVFYPDEGVAKMQRLQMATQGGNNVFVSAIIALFYCLIFSPSRKRFFAIACLLNVTVSRP